MNREWFAEIHVGCYVHRMGNNIVYGWSGVAASVMVFCIVGSFYFWVGGTGCNDHTPLNNPPPPRLRLGPLKPIENDIIVYQSKL
jgi:hypothetical protein